MTEKGGAATPKNDIASDTRLGGGSLKVCDEDIGCGEPDASGGWRQEYKHQRVVAAIAQRR